MCIRDSDRAVLSLSHVDISYYPSGCCGKAVRHTQYAWTRLGHSVGPLTHHSFNLATITAKVHKLFLNSSKVTEKLGKLVDWHGKHVKNSVVLVILFWICKSGKRRIVDISIFKLRSKRKKGE